LSPPSTAPGLPLHSMLTPQPLDLGHNHPVARIRRLTREQLPADMSEFIAVDERSDVELAVASITGHRPDLAIPLGNFTRALKARGVLPRRLIELVRLRIAFHNQCRSCMAIRYRDGIDDGVTEDLVCSLERPEESEDLTDSEKVALEYADLFATDHLSIDDEIYERMHQHFTEGEIVELGMNVALYVGIGRLAATWNITEDLPDEFRGVERIAPWTASHVVVR
jgi:AhpD family alkylhydroperoxidase